MLAAVDRLVRALARSARIGVVDEAPLPDGVDDAAERMVDDPVPKRRGADQPQLALPHVEIAIGAGRVGVVGQFRCSWNRSASRSNSKAATSAGRSRLPLRALRKAR